MAFNTDEYKLTHECRKTRVNMANRTASDHYSHICILYCISQGIHLHYKILGKKTPVPPSIISHLHLMLSFHTLIR